MDKITKVISVGLLTVLMSLFAASIAFAVGDVPPGSAAPSTNVDTPDELLELVINISRWIEAFVLVVGIIFLILAGYNWISSGGDETKITTARQQLIWGIVGIGVAILAFGAVQLVDTLLG